MTSQPKNLPILRGYLRTPLTNTDTNTPRVAPYLEIHGVNHTVDDLADRSVSVSDMNRMHMDLSSRKKLPPKLDDAALIEITEKYLTQCSGADAAVTYEGMLIQHIVPELVNRLKETGD